ncbi:MAG: ribonuclease III, partial [Acidobacteria bacterium]|nr:ribonuclease III [Acidobacteriota bacterium]
MSGPGREGQGKSAGGRSPLERRLNYRFRSAAFLERALTHSSRANEIGRQGQDNEVLEFLGDAVLSLIASELLFRAFPDTTPGELSRLRSRIVSESSLAALARSLGLGRHLRLGKSERTSGGSDRPSLLADAYEAVLAALFLDGGLGPVRAFLEAQIRPLLREFRRDARSGLDFKTRLQELLQQRKAGLPAYRLESTDGPPHERRFTVVLRVEGKVAGRGTDRTK